MLCILKGMVFEPFCSEVGYRFNRFEDSHRARFCSLCLDQGLELGIFFIIYLLGRVFQLCSEVANFPHFPWNRLRVSGHILHTLTHIFEELSTKPFGFFYCVISLSNGDNNSPSVVKMFLKKWIHTLFHNSLLIFHVV